VARTSGTYGRIGSVSSASVALIVFGRMLRQRVDGRRCSRRPGSGRLRHGGGSIGSTASARRNQQRLWFVVGAQLHGHAAGFKFGKGRKREDAATSGRCGFCEILRRFRCNLPDECDCPKCPDTVAVQLASW
jgi:hypothetical protein